MDKFATIFVEFNCYEQGFGTGEDAPATIWLVPRRVEAYDFETLKTEAIRIVGPIALRVANQVAASLSEALRQLGITVDELTEADD